MFGSMINKSNAMIAHKAKRRLRGKAGLLVVISMLAVGPDPMGSSGFH